MPARPRKDRHDHRRPSGPRRRAHWPSRMSAPRRARCPRASAARNWCSANSASSGTPTGRTPPAPSTARASPFAARRSSSTSLPPRSSASCRTSGTRAAMATDSSAPTRRPARSFPKSSVEPYVFWRRDRDLRDETGALGNLHQTTAGVRWVGHAALEVRLRRRNRHADRIARIRFGQRLGRPLPGADAGVRPVAASGVRVQLRLGRRGPDRRQRGTFDQLYPTPHDKYGLADQVGWRNIHHVRAGRRDRAHQGHARSRRTTTRGGWPAPPTGSTWPTARCSPGSPAARRIATSVRSSTCRSVARADAAAAARRRLRLHPSRRVSEGGDARRVLQHAVRDGDLRLSGGEVR